MCYELGVGTTQNYNEARKCFMQSAHHGVPEAIQALKVIDEKIRTECPLLSKPVQIKGASREDLNGRAGVATSFDHARGRYVVELEEKDNSRNASNAKIKVKPENLIQAGF